MISKKYRVALKRLMWVFIPAVLVLVVGVAILEGYLTYRLTRPPKTHLYGSPKDFQEILQKPMWFDEKWRNADGTSSVGWFLSHGKSGPVIILSHGYGTNRSQLLTLSFELWKAGYHVLVYDLRGHGESPVDWSGLGTYEREDLISGISFVRGLKDDAGQPLLDGRIGLYGIEIGGYVSLLAASQSPLVRAVAVDSVYPDFAHYVNYRLRSLVGDGNAMTRLADADITNHLTDLALHTYLMRRDDDNNAGTVIKTTSGRRILFIVGKDSGALGPMTRDLYARAQDQKELAEVDKSRLDRLYDKESADYDARVVAFFNSAIPIVSPTPGARASK
jgi:pimeloyl-ACP methyl ester carboxylesterase